jgi:hypothetical protein
MLNSLPLNHVYQVISNFGIFILLAISIFTFKKLKIGKDGVSFEKDDLGNNITLKTINDKIEERFKGIEKQISAIEECDKTQSCDILRINFYLQKQPDETKLVSGLRYLKGGGNGKTRGDILAFIETHKELYDAIIALEPSLAVKS